MRPRMTLTPFATGLALVFGCAEERAGENADTFIVDTTVTDTADATPDADAPDSSPADTDPQEIDTVATAACRGHERPDVRPPPLQEVAPVDPCAAAIPLPEIVEIGAEVHRVVGADLDADGLEDVVLATEGGIAVVRSLGEGALGPPTHLTLAGAASAVAAGPLTAAGDVGLVSSDAGSGALTVWLRDGSGSWEVVQRDVAGTDSAGDARDVRIVGAGQDVGPAVVSAGDDDVWVTVSELSDLGVLHSPRRVPVLRRPARVDVLDLDEDERQDLVVASEEGFTVLLGLPGGGFPSPPSVAVGAVPRFVRLADLDGDGHLDLVTANRGAPDVTVALGLEGGAFGAPTSLPLGDRPIALEVADLDGDALADIVVATVDDNQTSYDTSDDTTTVSAWLGAADGPIALASSRTVELRVNALEVAAANGDSHDDLILLAERWEEGEREYLLLVALGLGDGTFASPSLADANETCLLAADLDADGVADLVTWAPGAWVRRGLGDGTFAAPSPVSDAWWGAATVAELTGDAHLDIAALANGQLLVFEGHGDGTFEPERSVPGVALGDGHALRAADVDRDGAMDLLAINRSAVVQLAGDGLGGFGERRDWIVGADPVAFAIGDVDGDGWSDLLAANGAWGGVSLVRGLGGGLFDAARAYIHPLRGPLAAGDFDGDGAVDVALAGEPGELLLLAGDGAGTFAATPRSLTAPLGAKPGWDPRVWEVVAGDLDGGGAEDDVLIVLPEVLTSWLAPLDDNATTWSAPVLATLSAGNLVDLDGDGRDDLVGVIAGEGGPGPRLAVLRNLGGGRLHAGKPSERGAGGSFVAPVLTHLDGDGIPDLLYSPHPNAAVWIRRGLGDGTFEKEPVWSTPASKYALGDLTGDGFPDVLALHGRWLTQWHHDGEGTLVEGPTEHPPFPMAAFGLADLDGDGLDDVFATEDITPGGYDLVALLNRGGGDLCEAGRFEVGYGAYFPVAADLDGDGAADVLIGTHSPDALYVWTGIAEGRAPVAFDPPPLVGWMPHLADLDGDGVVDLLATGHRDDDEVLTLHRGRGDGTFAAPEELELGLWPHRLAVADVNVDGIPDLLVSGGRPAPPADPLFGAPMLAYRPGLGGGAFGPGPTAAVRSAGLVTGDLDGDGAIDLLVDAQEVFLTFGGACEE